ncbi:hypothetical protein SAMN05421644_11034 [Allochromatium warmingii]|uniref:Uncharacterized protein n=1 Tax=Allochromatium warmingii TaxID=61595 RepID=A0A1H3DXX0_ALLWA|nr:hypothetical protein [Allochromatium warmingii]SDX70534.1 hypothetical protein SAMN05421644_11034 [Allochromatium warmingii]
MSNLKARIEKLEDRIRPGTVLIVLAERGETSEEAIERAARAWRRSAESFPVKIVLDFHGGAAKL